MVETEIYESKQKYVKVTHFDLKPHTLVVHKNNSFGMSSFKVLKVNAPVQRRLFCVHFMQKKLSCGSHRAPFVTHAYFQKQRNTKMSQRKWQNHFERP